MSIDLKMKSDKACIKEKETPIIERDDQQFRAKPHAIKDIEWRAWSSYDWTRQI